MLSKSKMAGAVINAGTQVEILFRRLGESASEGSKKALRYWERQIDQRQLLEIPGLEEMDELHAQVELDNRTRTIPIHKRSDISLTYDCNDLPRGDDGHVIQRDIDERAALVWNKDIKSALTPSG